MSGLPLAPSTMARVIHVPDTEFAPVDIPSDDVIEGDPILETGDVWTSADGSKMSGVSRVSPGRFYFDQPHHETSYYLSGHLVLTQADGSTVDLRAGDLVHLKPGARWDLNVIEPVVAFWVASSADGRPVSP